MDATLFEYIHYETRIMGPTGRQGPVGIMGPTGRQGLVGEMRPIRLASMYTIRDIPAEIMISPVRIFPSKLLNKINQIKNDSGDKECCICFENTAGKYKFNPCEHNDICMSCTTKLNKNECPLCRSVIHDVILA